MRATTDMFMRLKSLRSAALATAAFIITGTVATACGELTGPVSPSTPTNVVVTLLSATSARVTWTPSPLNDGVISYTIYRNGTQVGESTTTSFTDTGLAQQTTYVYSVAANCKGGVVSDRSVETAQSTVTTIDITPPTVLTTSPGNGASGISRSATATATFSEPMDPNTINTSTFNLRISASGALIPGTVTYNPTTRVAEFDPTDQLPNQIQVTTTVTTGAKDLSGNALAANYTATWTTSDQEGPSVVVSPANGAVGVSPNVIVTATFSEPVDATTVNSTNIFLRAAGSSTNVPGTASFNSATRVYTFTPTSPLAQGTTYTFTVTGVKDTQGNTMPTPSVTTFTVGDLIAPTVTGVVPTGPGVAINTNVQISFSEAMDQATINSTNIVLRNTATSAPVTATVSYNSTTNVATLLPSGPLSNSTGYTLTVSTEVKDLSGNRLAAPFISTFTTIGLPDTTAPTVVATTPTGTASLALDSATVRFSEAMDPATLTTTTVRVAISTAPTTNICASVTYVAATMTAVCKFSVPLVSNGSYNITVTTGVKDVSNNALAAQFSASFTAETDLVRPTVTATTPLDNTANISRTAAITVTFSEPMNSATITSATVFVTPTAGGANAAGTVSYNASLRQAIFTPAAGTPLQANTQYTVTVTSGVQDANGNGLLGNFTFKFTTGS
jgi:Big-like domain-containing protein/fibronectin type III domain protein